MDRSIFILCSFLTAAAVATPGVAAEPPPAGGEQLHTDSRAPYVHRLTLYDRDGTAIDPKGQPGQPYSPSATCGKCHPVASIRGGWHFNADRPSADAGRPGEPWVFTDPRSGTQLPLSTRGWPGTFKPADVGLSSWAFTLAFGRHLPGGGLADPDPAAAAQSAESARWGISGRLEIDCLFCHSVGSQHDPAEAARQLERENLQWAPTAAFGLGVIRGDARKVPDDFDPLAPPNPDYPEQSLPVVNYDRTRFDGDNRVLFDLTKRPAVGRCYFCHTVREVGPDAREGWAAAPDVHMAAGLVCTDCHVNDVDHLIARGYAGEAEQRKQPALAALSCAGCHLGREFAVEEEEEDEDEDTTAPVRGRYGAPYPEHRGLPPLHLRKLSCTACHSGPWPTPSAQRVQTSLAHQLGLPSKDRGDDALPLIVEPVFAAQPDGKIASHRLLWPSFWGRLEGETLAPLPLDVVRRAADAVMPKPKKDEPPATAPLADEQIGQMLAQLAAKWAGPGEPVYVRSGRVYRRDSSGQVQSAPHASAKPCLWPFAHDVRPAAQSLGVRGCTDCHAPGAPFFFGRIAAAADEATRPPMEFMHQLQGLDPALVRTWGSSFAFRPLFKWAGFICAGLVGAVLLLYGFQGLGAVLRRFR